MNRTVELLEMPTGPALLNLLPRLADALTGAGPAVVPVAAGDAARIAALSRAFGTGTALTAGEDDPDDPTVVVISTSGSTGPPKGALLSRSALTVSAAATARRLGPPGTWLLTLPGQHIAGLQVLLRALAGGIAPAVLDTALPFTPERFTAATAAMPTGPRYLSLVPTQLHRLLGDASGVAALQTFSAVLVGGSATGEPLLEQARQAGIQLVTTYGMSETCGGCVYDGVPLAGVEVDLDPAGGAPDGARPNEEMPTGSIRIQGPVVARGYRLLPAHPAFSGPRTFRTDDIGQWVDGRLRILGRVDDVLTTGGLKIAPAELEAAIGRLASVGDVVVVGVPDAQWGQVPVAVLTVAHPHHPPGIDDIRSACAQADIPRVLQPRRLVVVDALPLRGPGKPDRVAVLELARRER